MAWIKTTIGLYTDQKTLLYNPGNFTFQEPELVSDLRNTLGDLIRNGNSKISASIQVRYDAINFTELNKILSIANVNYNYIYIKCFDASSPYLQIIDERRISITSGSVKLRRSSRRWIAIDGVWLASDTTHVGTNYYTGGSYADDTQIITLGSVLPSANEQVIINYTYCGWKVMFNGNPQWVASVANLFNVSMNFIGV